MTLPLMALGGNGVISVASNLVPSDMVRFIGSALEGNWETARKEHFHLLPLFRGLFLETNPIPVKTAMAMAGLLKQANYRLPMCAMGEANKQALEKVMRNLGIVH